VPAARFQAFRVPKGVYEQRENGTFMLRARLAAGILLPAQMRVAAEAARSFGDGTLHLTSRQDLQVHGVRVENIPPALEALAAAGLSTLGGGGNTVRNIAACYQAGVCDQELFDVTPAVIGLTEGLLPDPISYQLPRKYKIAFSGCSADCAGATVNDLGFVARRRDGEPGFAVYVGGGMGAESRVGQLLEEFVPAGRALAVAEAVKRVFDQHGNRKNRHRARIRFLVEDLGIETFLQLYRQALMQLAPELALRPMAEPVIPPREPDGQAAAPGFDSWRELHVQKQRQQGFHSVEIAPRLGVFKAAQLAQLAAVVEQFGEGLARATNWQSLMLRWVGEHELPGLHRALSALGLGTAQAPLLRHMVTCTGASTCRLGIGLSRGLAEAIELRLAGRLVAWKPATGALTLNISGCPNACGRHPVAQIGLHGAARRVRGRLVPYYFVQLGGRVAEGETVLASGPQLVPARNVPAFVEELLEAFDSSPAYPDFAAFLRDGGRERASALAERFSRVPAFEENPDFYEDWGAGGQFSLAGRGPGECGAGVFDLIQVDMAASAAAIQNERLFAATVAASRALLVTHGQQADTDRQAIDAFDHLFVQGGLVSADFASLLDRARQAVDAVNPEAAFPAEQEEVSRLLETVRELYRGMGPSLRVARTG
jgi:sulfite reductase (ferredoxin)